MNDRKNITPEIEAALAEGRAQGIREAAEYVRGLKQMFVPWVMRGLDGVPEAGPDGWGDLLDREKRALRKAADGIERLVNHDPIPEHQHIWNSEADPCCAGCGKLKSEI